MRISTRIAACGIALLSALTSVHADPVRSDSAHSDSFGADRESLADIRAAAERYVTEHSPAAVAKDGKIQVTAGALDARLKLAPCAGKLTAFTLNGAQVAARTSVGVKCDQGARWTVYVPVTIESDIDVLVLRQSLQRDAHIAADDVEVQRRHVVGYGNLYATDLDRLREQHLKFFVAGGTVLRQDMFARDLVVKRGQHVTMVLNVSGLTVRAPGVALSDGGTADRISVRNLSSLKVVDAVVESGNLVRVGM